jgi:hypothetical protein
LTHVLVGEPDSTSPGHALGKSAKRVFAQMCRPIPVVLAAKTWISRKPGHGVW